MDLAEATVALLAAALGAATGVGTTAWSFRRATAEARLERISAEEANLRALVMEVRVVEHLTGEESPSPLPTDVLTVVLGTVHHMTAGQQRAVIDYAQAVRRYNGRVVRLVAYGAGKRAAGERPGAEAPTDHARLVERTTAPVLTAVQEHLESDRFELPGRRRARTRGASSGSAN